ncbi:23S rRNA Gm-2251 2'-O-methyltransferase [Orbus hercynius]|uniref:23S rRNA (guanosine-2'-O-)-methyltransferase RlmB n=1 Tax=Orbus hercynius TaxID=593135 RepID=A0A495RCI2_9GAMM|nr:23S rRNA (guanosine(2251)-2'-O)-methyltransferase RlmB [Orbus hercynius]RKS84728.1 23S rRNA Gm-2251 2'-O-methyltransferase [Orbus hercynius]
MSEIIYGMHAMQGMLARSPERILDVYLLKNRDDKRLNSLVSDIESLGLPVKLVDKKWLDEQTSNGVHQGIVARIKEGRNYHENDLPDLLSQHLEPLILILDGVTDPHNLGACIRTADAAGVNFIIVPKDKSAPLNATAKKVACGAAESVPVIRVTNLARTLRMLKEEYQIWLVGTAGEADHSIYQSRLSGKLAIIMGAEGEGMRRLTKEHCDELVSIPMSGFVSSLNVSVATGICLFEVVRQKSKTI